VKFELRLATPRDAPEIVDLQIAAWRAAFVPLLPLDFQIPPREQFLIMGERAQGEAGVERTVAELDGRLAGFCTHGPSRDAGAPPEVGELRAIFVHPDRWRAGVGTALVDNALDSLRRAGFSEVIVWSFRDNAPANRFYERHGFRPDGAAETRELFGDAVVIRYRHAL
jgi:GNAT superfamily N-acetyltransferase